MLLLSEACIILMVVGEYRSWHCVVAPTVILGCIYAFLLPLVNTVGVAIGFLRVEDFTLFCFTSFLFLFFFIGQITRRINIIKPPHSNKMTCRERLLAQKHVIWLIYVISLICYVVSLAQVIHVYGINDTKSHAFGFFAHIGFISRCLFPIVAFYFIETKKLKYLVALIINTIALIMFQGKYHLYIPVVGAVVLFLLLNPQFRGKTVFAVGFSCLLGGWLLFVMVYTIVPDVLNGDTQPGEMLSGTISSSRHFLHYLFCPLIDSNEYFLNPQYEGFENGIRTAFNPFDTLYQAFLGEQQYFSPVVTLWPEVDVDGTTANVGGLFSESILSLGYPIGAIYIAIIGLITYSFFKVTFTCGTMIVSTVCLLGMLACCFFCNYFTLLPNMECFVYSLLLDCFVLNHPKLGKTQSY